MNVLLNNTNQARCIKPIMQDLQLFAWTWCCVLCTQEPPLCRTARTARGRSRHPADGCATPATRGGLGEHLTAWQQKAVRVYIILSWHCTLVMFGLVSYNLIMILYIQGLAWIPCPCFHANLSPTTRNWPLPGSRHIRLKRGHFVSSGWD